jgi:catechol 2,3-dioxygenase-like lactoylglutathione lyase family enzyme
MKMKPRITLITLGSDDLERSLAFYRDGLGWPTEGILGTEFEYGATAFFDLQGGLKLAIWHRASIALDSCVGQSEACSTEMIIGHNVSTRQEVDEVMALAERAGARIVKPAIDTFWGGYSGYFQDPDGHLWEIAWYPGWGGMEL